MQIIYISPSQSTDILLVSCSPSYKPVFIPPVDRWYAYSLKYFWGNGFLMTNNLRTYILLNPYCRRSARLHPVSSGSRLECKQRKFIHACIRYLRAGNRCPSGSFQLHDGSIGCEHLHREYIHRWRADWTAGRDANLRESEVSSLCIEVV